MIKVREVKALPGYRLSLVFSDGSKGEVNIRYWIDRMEVFKPLLDKKIFSKVYLEYGATTWPGEIDISPEALYAQAHGFSKPTTYEEAAEQQRIVSLRLRKSK